MKKNFLRLFIVLVSMLVIFNLQSCLLFSSALYDEPSDSEISKTPKPSFDEEDDDDDDDYFPWYKKPNYKKPYIKRNPLASEKKIQIEKEILQEINLVRMYPEQYADRILKKYIYSSNAAYECYTQLLKMPKLKGFELESGLSKTAKWLTDHQSKTGEIGSQTKVFGYERPKDRIDKFGFFYGGDCGESISYGYSSAREIVLQLLIDDGIVDRNNRNNILNPDFQKIGIAIATHPKYDYVCVIDFVNTYFGIK